MEKNLSRLILIDGNAILHRAFHALPLLTTSKGELVNAVYGFISMLLKVRDELNPAYFAVSFDLPKPTFRNKLFANYQAQRPKMAEELVGQIKRVKEVIRALGIPIYEKEGYEADDVLGTLARQAVQLSDSGQSVSRFTGKHDRKTEKLKNQKLKTENREPITEVIIVTGDRDILQLVDEKTKVYMLIKGLTEATLYDEAKVKEKYGLKPKQIPDYKALIGDPSDNYPGVAGIGPKTAVALLQEYETLENLYKCFETFKQKEVVQKLAEGREQAVLGKKLATIVTDVPVKFDLAMSKVKTFNTSKVRRLFEELEFKSLIPRLKQKEGKEDKENKEEGKKSEQMGLF